MSCVLKAVCITAWEGPAAEKTCVFAGRTGWKALEEKRSGSFFLVVSLHYICSFY